MTRKENALIDVISDEVLETIERRQQEARDGAEMKAIQAEILAHLALLGGKTHHEEDVLFEGTKLIIPSNMNIQQTIDFLEKKRQEEEASTDFSRTFNYRPMDGAFSMYQVLKRTFGAIGHRHGGMGMWGPTPPKLRSVPIGVDTKEQVPWGMFTLPFLDGVEFNTGVMVHQEKGPLFSMTVSGPKKYRFEVEGIFNLIQEELKTNSIYRGKAFDGQTEPEFIDVFSVDRERVVYSEEVMTQLTANIWAQLRHTEQFKALGIPLKRAVLIHGPYGTGKTLAALLTGQEAVANGWTYIKARPGKDDLGTVMQTARLYEPCVVFYEDIDQIAGADEEGIQKLLDDFDGIEAKGTRILCVLTTNFPEKIHKGMARPGRLDAMIEINALDQRGVELLVRSRIGGQLAENIEWADVYEAAMDYKPAFVTEGADRTIRYLLAQTGSVNGMKVSTNHLVSAMEGLRPQFDVMTGAKDAPERVELSRALGNAIEPKVAETVERVLQNHRVDREENGALVPLSWSTS